MKDSKNLRLHRRDFFKKSVAGLIGSFGGFYTNFHLNQARNFKKPLSPTDKNWSRIRSHFILRSGTAYMNNASLGMPPLNVVNSVKTGYEEISKEPLRGKRNLQNNINNRVLPLLAKTFNTNKDEVVLTRNASEALFLQTLGMVLNRGDEVVLSTQEHPAALKPWKHREIKDGIILKYVFIPSPLISKRDVVSRLMSAVTPKTKAMSFCHVTRGGHISILTYSLRSRETCWRDRFH